MDLGEKGGAGREWEEGEAAKTFAFLVYPLSLSLPPLLFSLIFFSIPTSCFQVEQLPALPS